MGGGWVDKLAQEGMVRGRIWQAKISKRITAWVPMENGHVVEDGDFAVDGVAFGGAEIKLEFHDPAGGAGHPRANWERAGERGGGRADRAKRARADFELRTAAKD